jgi:hypothetical protein
VKEGICSGDQARGLVRRFARLMTSALAIATTGTLPPPAKAQQEDGATSPAVSIPVRPALRTDTAQKGTMRRREPSRRSAGPRLGHRS